MSAEDTSFIVRCRGDDQSGATRLQVVLVRADHATDVRFNEVSFLVRVSIDKERAVERCSIRHIASGREAFVQGGAGLSTFVKECLLEGPGSMAEPAVKGETRRSAR
jgi:hypothetical protein